MTMQKAAVDTNFFIESAGELPGVELKRSPYTEECSAMLKLAGHKYECCIPLIVPGEFLAFLNDKVASPESRTQLLRQFKHWLTDGRFQVVKMDHDITDILSRLDGMRLADYHDHMIVACALVSRCNILFTTDGEIKDEELAISKLSRELNAGQAIHIAHPKDRDFQRWVNS